MEVIGVSRNGVATTETGSNLLVTLNVGASSTVGIGSTLFEITSFEIARDGYAFKRGDKLINSFAGCPEMTNYCTTSTKTKQN